MAKDRPVVQKVLRVVKCQSINAIEALYRPLQSAPHNLDLSIPTTTTDAHLGAIGSLIQFISTWAKRCPSGHLLMHDKDEKKLKLHITNLSSTHHGLVALLASRAVLSSDKRLDLSLEAEIAALLVLSVMRDNSLGYVTGPELLLICADATTLCRMPQLYHDLPELQGKVRSQEEFVELAGASFDRLSKLYKRSEGLREDLKQELGTVLYELFKNTDLWATTEIDNSPVERSVRGIRLELTTCRNLRLESLADQHQQYVDRMTALLGERDLLEIAVFDSGPGLASRALERTPDERTSLHDEYLAVIKCLRLHASTTSKSHRGVGLLEVMRSLTRANGFLRIRTGRLALYRDFCSSPLNSADDLYLYDWSTGSTSLSDCGRAEGLLLSMLIPVPSGAPAQ
jgi:hypothetical protein